MRTVRNSISIRNRLEETYKSFVRSGANLSDADQQKLRALNEKISTLQITFEQNMLKETNAFKLVITDEKDLSGLPASLIAQAAETAKGMGEEGKWVFTLHNPSIMPFLQYADREITGTMPTTSKWCAT